MPLAIFSSAFDAGEEIPTRYTCDGDDISPPLAWAGLPEGTKSLALIVDDPDAPDPENPRMTWVHWVLYNPANDGRTAWGHQARGPAGWDSAGAQRLEAVGLWRPVPTERPTPLLSQALCTRYDSPEPRHGYEGGP